MSVLQTVNLSADAVKMRWKEPYVTAGINQKFIASHPKGVLAGFGVVPSAGFVVNVQLDPSLNLSVANVLETTGGKFSVTVVQTANVLIDLTAQANTTVFIVLDAQYTVGASSAAQVKVVDAAELSTNLDLVVLAKVNVPLVGPVTTSHINLGYRDASGDYGPPEQEPHFNLVHNPYFEASTDGWTNNGFTLMAASTDTAHTANYSLKLMQAVAGLVNAVTAPMPVVPGRGYRTTAWLRSTGGDPVTGGNGAKVQVGFYDAAGAQIGGWTDIEAAWTGGSTTWELRRSEVTAPTLAYTAKLRVFFDNAAGTLYVDDVEFASHMHDEVMKSAVFGGAGSVADDWHKHSALGLTYAGSSPNNWADGTNIPAGSIESGIDAVVTALGPSTGASKVGFLPATPVDLTATRVDTALNELDDKKAGLAQPNVFTRVQTVNPSSVNETGVVAYGKGTGSFAGVQGAAVYGEHAGAGPGLTGMSGATGGADAHGVVGITTNYSPTWTGYAGGPFGVLGRAGDDGGYGYGVVGIGDVVGGGSGVVGVSNESLTVPAVPDAGVVGLGQAGVVGRGDGVVGVGGDFRNSATANDGVAAAVGTAQNTNGVGLKGQGTGTGVGVWGDGGSAAPTSGDLTRGAGVRGIGGSGNGNGVYGRGGSGTSVGSTSLAWANTGVVGVGSNGGVGVVGVSAATSGTGVHGGSFMGADGFDTNGVAALGKGAGHGVIAHGGPTGNALRVGTGHAAFIGGNPTFSTPFINTVVPSTVVKAWARMQFASGVSSIVSGFNVTSITDTNLALGTWTLNLANTVTKATRAAWVMANAGVSDTVSVDFGGGTDSTMVFVALQPGGANRDLTAVGPFTYVVLVFGLQ